MNVNTVMTMESVVSRNKKTCTECRICDSTCPLVKWLGYKKIEDAPLGHCFLCGHCVAVCPNESFKHKEIKIRKKIGKSKYLEDEDSIYNYLLLRRTIREFKTAKIKKEHWNKIFDMVKYAPNSCNFEYIDLMVVESKDVIRKLSNAVHMMIKRMNILFNIPIINFIFKRILGTNTYKAIKADFNKSHIQKESMKRGHDPILFNAPALLLFIGPTKESTCQVDALLAAQNVAVLTPSLGIGVCFSGLITHAYNGLYPPIKKVLPLPKGYSVHATLMVGYQKYNYENVATKKDRNIFYIK